MKSKHWVSFKLRFCCESKNREMEVSEKPNRNNLKLKSVYMGFGRSLGGFKDSYWALRQRNSVKLPCYMSKQDFFHDLCQEIGLIKCLFKTETPFKVHFLKSDCFCFQAQ